MDAVKSLNGEMWIFASLLIAVVILQAVLFLRLALRVNKKHQFYRRDVRQDEEAARAAEEA